MNAIHAKMNVKIINIFLYSICFCVLFLFCIALIRYPGKSYIYVLFTLSLNALLFFGFRKGRLFFDTFIGIFFWLGYWLKFSVRMAFMDGKFAFSVGSNFNYSGADYDHALFVTTCGTAALLTVNFIRKKIFFTYSEKKSEISLEGLFSFYKKYKTIIWIAFIGLFVSASVTNAYMGIYQRGTVPSTQLPFKLGGIYTWFLLFGGASISSLILEFEFTLNRKATYSAVVLSIFESFFSNVSMLSRGMILNVSAMLIGAIKSLKLKSIITDLRFLFIIIFIFAFLFFNSTFIVNQLRSCKYSADAADQAGIGLNPGIGFNPVVSGGVKILMLDRWVGIEGVMAVTSYPKLGWDLWKRAWKEKYSHHGTSFYDLKIASSYYTKMDFLKHHFITLPGILAFLYYPGSFIFLFFSMFLVGTLSSAIEITIYKLTSNVILTSLFAQVVAYRYAHFGYAPGNSYLLFGTIFINVLLIYFLNKFLLTWNRKRGNVKSSAQH